MTATTAATTLPRWIAMTGRVGLVVFALFNLVVFVLVAIDPMNHSVVQVYREGSLGWWRGDDIFGAGTAGFIYLPSFAVLYTPFALLGAHVGDILWRLVSAALLALAIAEALRVALPQFGTRERWLLVGVALLIALPGAANSLRNGQATNILYSLMLLGTVAAIDRRWWLSGFLLALAFALKPLAIVFMLLMVVLQPAVLLPLLVWLVALMLLPLANPDLAHAWTLYGLGIHKVLVSGAPEAGRWADLTGLLGRFGIVAPESVLTVLRMIAALATLGLGWVTLRRNGRVHGLLNLYALSVVYLMLMSPRTEAQTYLMLSATMAIAATIAWHGEGARLRASIIIVLAVLIGATGLGPGALAALDLWWDPFLCVLYLPFLIADCLRLRPDATAPALPWGDGGR